MKHFLTWLFIIGTLCLPAQNQTYNANIYPSTTGLSLGRNGQRWNLYGQNIHITGTFTAPVVSSSATPASGYMFGYFKAGRGFCAKDAFGREYCPGGGTTGGGGTPGGSDTDLQYNNNGAFGGFPDGTPNQVLHGGRTFSSVVEADQSLSDVTTADVSITQHGYAPKLPNDATRYLDGTGAYSIPAGGGGASTVTTYIPLEDCTPDQTGNSFYSVASMTNWFNAHWEFVHGQASYLNCKVRIPNTVAATPAASIVLEIAANDNTSGHTANFQSCDAVVTTGTLNVAAPSCAANQAFTTTTTAYERVTKTYAVQSTVAANNLLVVKIATATTGTQPTANMIVYPYLKIDQNSVGGGGGGGGGTVTSFAANDLAPLFTTTEATATTTPVLSFALSTAAAHTAFMNNTGSTAAPGFQAIGQGDVTGLVAALALLAPKASPTFTGTVTMPAPTVNNITGMTQCLHVNTAGVMSGTGLDCPTGSPGPSSIKSMSSYANAQAALTALTSGQTLLVDGTFTLCNGTLPTANVVLKGAGFQSGILQCATNNVPVLTVSADGVEVANLNIKHITNAPIAGGDGLVVAAGTTSVRIIDNIIQRSYNGLNVGNTSFGVIEGNYIQFNNNHALVFTADGTSQVMQWLLKGNLFAQSLGDGVNFTLGAAISGLHITGPTITAGNRTYGNAGYGYKFSASAATASGISDIFIGGNSFASYNNKSGLYLDVGSDGGRNASISGFFSELAGQSVNTAGFASTTLTPSNVGHGVEITSACDPTNPPSVNGIETWQNSFSGAISACAGTQFTDIQAYKNGMASSANSYERAAVAVRASRMRVSGTAHDNTSQQTYGVDISNSADVLNISFTCGSTYTAANCIKKTTTPATLTGNLPGTILMNAATWTSGTGTPEAVVTAPIGSMFTRTDGGASTTLYIKESGAGNTGWIAK